MVILSKIPRLLNASAFTVCPVIFLDPACRNRMILEHERVHLRQQFLFGIVGAMLGMLIWIALGWPLQPMSFVLVALGLVEGWVCGQLLWRGLYLLALPVGWNPFRYRWEMEAYRTEVLDDVHIKRILKQAPYYLWWM